jgi:hypothetical protein
MIKETWKYASGSLHLIFFRYHYRKSPSPNTVYLARSCPRSTHICLRSATANIAYTETLQIKEFAANLGEAEPSQQSWLEKREIVRTVRSAVPEGGGWHVLPPVKSRQKKSGVECINVWILW